MYSTLGSSYDKSLLLTAAALNPSMLIFLCLFLVFAFIVAVLIFGDSPTFRNTLLEKLHRWLIWFKSKTFQYATENSTVYCALRWMVPGMYCGMIFGCLVGFFTHVYKKLTIRHIGGHSVYIIISILTLVLTTELITFSDPGYISSENVGAALEKYSDNNLIFFSGKTCSTCRLPKPARSKHCSVCNRCVSLFDHHCLFVNNCIGQNNYQWFIAFLLANINFMAYGGYLCWTLLNENVMGNGWWYTITRTSEANKSAGILLILAFVFSLVVFVFTLLHFRYMYLGVTTNEADKWGGIEHLVSIGALFYVTDLNIYVEQATSRSDVTGAYELIYISLDDQRILFSQNNCHNLKKVLSMEADLTNIYDQGFFGNVKSRLFSKKLKSKR